MMVKIVPELPKKGDTIPPTPTQPRVGVDALPALRFVIIADGSNLVSLIDETADVIPAFWESPTLNRTQSGQQPVWSMTKLLLYYSCNDDVHILLQTSGDGGKVWSESKTWALKATRGAVRSSLKGVNQTGFDLRFQLGFRQELPVSIHAYRPSLIERGSQVLLGR